MTMDFIVPVVAVAAVLVGLGANLAVRRHEGAHAAGTVQGWLLLAAAAVALVGALTGEHHRLLHVGLFLVLFATAVVQLRRSRKPAAPAGTPTA